MQRERLRHLLVSHVEDAGLLVKAAGRDEVLVLLPEESAAVDLLLMGLQRAERDELLEIPHNRSLVIRCRDKHALRGVEVKAVDLTLMTLESGHELARVWLPEVDPMISGRAAQNTRSGLGKGDAVETAHLGAVGEVAQVPHWPLLLHVVDHNCTIPCRCGDVVGIEGRGGDAVHRGLIVFNDLQELCLEGISVLCASSGLLLGLYGGSWHHWCHHLSRRSIVDDLRRRGRRSITGTHSHRIHRPRRHMVRARRLGHACLAHRPGARVRAWLAARRPRGRRRCGLKLRSELLALLLQSALVVRQRVDPLVLLLCVRCQLRETHLHCCEDVSEGGSHWLVDVPVNSHLKGVVGSRACIRWCAVHVAAIATTGPPHWILGEYCLSNGTQRPTTPTTTGNCECLVVATPRAPLAGPNTARGLTST
mmetsp:Transcript_58141/g.138359  ORF Transcript_58141/g.138359 Transcript_58141/m.138359 type:complete len:422 (+) Transcript_58141:524-1789(+)